jgi:hypothetical protein
MGKQFPVVQRTIMPLIFKVKAPFEPEDEGTMVLQNVGNYSPTDTVSHPRRL